MVQQHLLVVLHLVRYCTQPLWARPSAAPVLASLRLASPKLISKTGEPDLIKLKASSCGWNFSIEPSLRMNALTWKKGQNITKHVTLNILSLNQIWHGLFWNLEETFCHWCQTRFLQVAPIWASSKLPLKPTCLGPIAPPMSEAVNWSTWDFYSHWAYLTTPAFSFNRCAAWSNSPSHNKWLEE